MNAATYFYAMETDQKASINCMERVASVPKK